MKKILLLILGIVLISFTSSLTYKQGIGLDFKQTCTNEGIPCNSSSICNVSMQYPNGTYLVNYEVMTNQNNGDFNYTLTPIQTTIQGTYVWNMYCCQSVNCGESHGTFNINYIGRELSTSQSLIYFILFIILILFFILILYFMGSLPDGNGTNEEGELISIGKTKYLKSTLLFTSWLILIAIFYITSNLAFAYIEEQLFAKILFMIFQICFALTLPLIVLWFIWVFVNILQDKKMKNLISKGIFPRGNLL